MLEKSEEGKLKDWDSLTFADNFIFCRVLEEHPEICQEILEMILGIKIDHVERPESEKQIKTDYHSHGIRFDVYVKDRAGRVNSENC